MFQIANPSSVTIQSTGTGTQTELISCYMSGGNFSDVAQGIALQITGGATATVAGTEIETYILGIQIGNSGDTSSTSLIASSVSLFENTTDIQQQGSATLIFNSGTASSSKISINNSSNVQLAYFDQEGNNALNIGSFANQDTSLSMQQLAWAHWAILALTTNHRSIQQKLWAMKILTLETLALFALSNEASNVTAITTDRTQTATLRLVSDVASPVGNATGIRGWDITKNGTSAELAFSYQNSDPFGQSLITEYPVMQLNGVSNQLQLPATGTQIVFAGDTNLYRFSTGTLQTDGNVIIGGLTANTAVATNGSKQLVSSVTTATELGYLSGTTSPVQTQINSKVAKAGDTMTGTLQLPAGSPTGPSLTFTGSTTTGLSAATPNTLSFDTSGIERIENIFGRHCCN